MDKKFTLTGLFLFLILGSTLYSSNIEEASAASSTTGKTLVLYDAASGTLPGTPSMNFTDFPPGAASPVFSNDAAVLDTTSSGQDTFAGWTSSQATTPGFPILDRANGFQVDFTLQVEEESHGRDNRSGFSLIVLSEDARGVELAFWENEIWAQSDANTGGLFQHGEGAVFPTSSGIVGYRLTVAGDAYTLTAGAQTVLTGPVRDYSAFDGFPDPYQTPNFLFLGDNTTSAQARVRLRFVSVTGAEPVMPTVSSIVTGTSTPPPAAPPVPSPSPTPVPTPAPIRDGFEFCPSSSLSLTLVLANSMLRKHKKSFK